MTYPDKLPEYIASGTTTDQGKLVITRMDAMNEFLLKYPNRRFSIRITINDPETTKGLRGYYFSTIIPMLRIAFYEQGEIYTEKDTDEFIRSISPVMQIDNVDIETGEYTTHTARISEISNETFRIFISWIQQYAAENLHILIENPFWKRKTYQR